MHFLGLDIGTTGCKGVLFNEDGKLIARAYREYPLISSKRGEVEVNPNEVWEKTKSVIIEISSKEKDISAISVSSMGETVTPVDAEGRFLHNSIISFDNRTAPYVHWWRKRINPSEIFNICGQSLLTIFTLNKILWIRDNKNEIYKKTSKFLCYEDLIIYLLCGESFIDYSLASRTMGFDIHTKKWSEKLLGITGIPEEVLAVPERSGKVVGKIKKKLAEELNLKKDVKIVTGGHDQVCAALGAGIIKKGVGMYATGTVECITLSLGSAPVLTDEMMKNNLCCYDHTVVGQYCTLAYNFTGGNLLKWYRDTFGERYKEEAKKKNIDPYSLIISDLPEEPTGIFVLPHFTMTGTPYLDSHPTSAILGVTLNTSEKELIKAFLEGLTYEIRLNLEILRKSEINIERLRATGGGAKSSIWTQIKADIVGIPIESLETTEASCTGAAILAGIGVGCFDYEEAVKGFVKVVDIFYPNKEKNEIYNEKFNKYEKIYKKIKEIGI